MTMIRCRWLLLLLPLLLFTTCFTASVQVPATTPARASVLHLSGDVPRPGDYNRPAHGITVGRLIAASGRPRPDSRHCIVVVSREIDGRSHSAFLEDPAAIDGHDLAGGERVHVVSVVRPPWIPFFATWLLAVVPLATWRGLRERHRRRRGLCRHCGYPRGPSAVCSECGRIVRAGHRADSRG